MSFMTIIHPLILAATHTTSTKAKPSSASGTIFYLVFLAAVFYLLWRFFMRPQSQRAKQQRQVAMTIEVGDEVLTSSGIFGTVLDLDDERATLQVGPNNTLQVVRASIARKLSGLEDLDFSDETPSGSANGFSTAPGGEHWDGGDTGSGEGADTDEVGVDAVHDAAGSAGDEAEDAGTYEPGDAGDDDEGAGDDDEGAGDDDEGAGEESVEPDAPAMDMPVNPSQPARAPNAANRRRRGGTAR